MGRYFCYRVLGALPVVAGIVVLVFFMVRLVPGDPVAIMSQGERRATAEEVALLRSQLGLDLPLHQQFARFVGDLAQGDLGTSYRTKQPVLEEIARRVPNTLELALTSLIIALVLGICIGMLAAVRKGSLFDIASMGAAVISISIPGFWIGLMAILVFAVQLRWLPVSGADSWRHLILPAAVLSLRSAAVWARIVRSSMLEVLNHDYVRTARAKGLHERVVIYRHAFRNALIPLATVFGFELGGIITGAFVIEAVFSYPGMGMLAVQALNNRDFPLIQGIVLVTALSYIAANILIDLLYGLLDPRIRESMSS
jgi:peptide/nickel transport system permease protein